MTKSPVQIRRKGDLIEIVDRRNRALLAWCFIGDDDNLERIADILSQKGQPHAAMELRELARSDRRNAARIR